MEKKEYISPEIEMIEFESEDIMSDSVGSRETPVLKAAGSQRRDPDTGVFYFPGE